MFFLISHDNFISPDLMSIESFLPGSWETHYSLRLYNTDVNKAIPLILWQGVTPAFIRLHRRHVLARAAVSGQAEIPCPY
jgi:hypothetical protein